MARRLGNKLAVFGAGATAFVAAAAIATGSAAPAKADLEDLLDPIIAPILTSLTDTIATATSLRPCSKPAPTGPLRALAP